MTPLIKEIIEELMTKIVRPMGDDLLAAGGIPSPQAHYKKIIESSLLSLQASVEARKDDEFRAAVEKEKKNDAYEILKPYLEQEFWRGHELACENIIKALLPKPKDE